MKRIKYTREYDVTIRETYEADVPDELLMSRSGLGLDRLDEYVTDNHSADSEDRLGMVEDSLVTQVTVQFSHDD